MDAAINGGKPKPPPAELFLHAAIYGGSPANRNGSALLFLEARKANDPGSIKSTRAGPRTSEMMKCNASAKTGKPAKTAATAVKAVDVDAMLERMEVADQHWRHAVDMEKKADRYRVNAEVCEKTRQNLGHLAVERESLCTALMGKKAEYHRAVEALRVRAEEHARELIWVGHAVCPGKGFHPSIVGMPESVDGPQQERGWHGWSLNVPAGLDDNMVVALWKGNMMAPVSSADCYGNVWERKKPATLPAATFQPATLPAATFQHATLPAATFQPATFQQFLPIETVMQKTEMTDLSDVSFNDVDAQEVERWISEIDKMPLEECWYEKSGTRMGDI